MSAATALAGWSAGEDNGLEQKQDAADQAAVNPASIQLFLSLCAGLQGFDYQPSVRSGPRLHVQSHQGQKQ